MSNPNNNIPYFEKLQTISPQDALMDILDSLKDEMEKHSYELSLGSKLLHTRNPAMPIYDSKVREYLTKEENVPFWWHVTGSSAPRGTAEREKIKHDWTELCNWYTMFLPSPRGKQWMDWFDSNFPTYRHISDVKKVDFIIFATN
jgi:coproporphyrinogen III oxidase